MAIHILLYIIFIFRNEKYTIALNKINNRERPEKTNQFKSIDDLLTVFSNHSTIISRIQIGDAFETNLCPNMYALSIPQNCEC
jgi:hypothetical protein